MYSEQLRAFINARRPEEIIWSEEEIRELAEEVGARVEGGRLHLETLDGDYAVLELPLTVGWEVEVGRDKVAYIPRVSSSAAWQKGEVDLGARLLEATGIESVVVELTGPAVILPIPKWVKFYSHSWGEGEVIGLTCFRSEAVGMVLDFLVELVKVFIGGRS